MDSNYFANNSIETKEYSSCQQQIKGKEYLTLANRIIAPTISFIKNEVSREKTELVIKLNTGAKTEDLLYRTG
jgi:hypothetical protein